MLTPRERGRLGGRPNTKGERHHLSIRVPIMTMKDIYRMADARGISANDWINEAIDLKMSSKETLEQDPQGQLPFDQQEAS